MSNIKQIEIIGELPFDAGNGPEGQRLLAQLNAPIFGLRITYGASRLVDNVKVNPSTPHRKGKTAMVSFRIAGCEAVSFQWYEWTLQTIKLIGGNVKSEHCKDLEAGECATPKP